MFLARACTSPLNCHSGICQSCLNKPVAVSAARLFMGCWLKVSQILCQVRVSYFFGLVNLMSVLSLLVVAGNFNHVVDG